MHVPLRITGCVQPSTTAPPRALLLAVAAHCCSPVLPTQHCMRSRRPLGPTQAHLLRCVYLMTSCRCGCRCGRTCYLSTGPMQQLLLPLQVVRAAAASAARSLLSAAQLPNAPLASSFNLSWLNVIQGRVRSFTQVTSHPCAQRQIHSSASTQSTSNPINIHSNFCSASTPVGLAPLWP